MTAEPTPIQVSTASLSESRWKTGDLYVYRHVCRCPGCNAHWAFEVAAPRGTIAPDVDPTRVGMGLLCGQCAAQRNAFAVFPVEGGRAEIKHFWGDQDERNAWGRLRGGRGYAPRITRSKTPWDRVTPLVDEREERMREILDVGGRRLPGITPERMKRLGLNWNTTEARRNG